MSSGVAAAVVARRTALALVPLAAALAAARSAVSRSTAAFLSWATFGATPITRLRATPLTAVDRLIALATAAEPLTTANPAWSLVDSMVPPARVIAARAAAALAVLV